MVAASSGNLATGTHRLAELWADLSVRRVFRADPVALGLGRHAVAARSSLGGLVGGGNIQSLLDATPLRGVLAQHLPFAGIAESIRAGHLCARGDLGDELPPAKSFTFIQGRKGHPALWLKSRRVSPRSRRSPSSASHLRVRLDPDSLRRRWQVPAAGDRR